MKERKKGEKKEKTERKSKKERYIFNKQSKRQSKVIPLQARCGPEGG
jgi:hypothetical protein